MLTSFRRTCRTNSHDLNWRAIKQFDCIILLAYVDSLHMIMEQGFRFTLITLREANYGKLHCKCCCSSYIGACEMILFHTTVLLLNKITRWLATPPRPPIKPSKYVTRCRRVPMRSCLRADKKAKRNTGQSCGLQVIFLNSPSHIWYKHWWTDNNSREVSPARSWETCKRNSKGSVVQISYSLRWLPKKNS